MLRYLVTRRDWLLSAVSFVVGSIVAAPWLIWHSWRMPRQMSGTGPWTFEFPRPPGYVGYVGSDLIAAVGQTITMQFSVAVSPGATFVVERSDTLPAHVTLFIQRRGDNLTGQGKYEFYRLWHPWGRVALENGTFTMTAVLDAAQWTGVFGQPPSEAQFADTLENARLIGFTFGGANFFAHGVSVALGNAEFTLVSYSVG